MDLAVDLALAGRTSIYRRLATTDDGLEAATEYSSAINEPLVRRKSPRVRSLMWRTLSCRVGTVGYIVDALGLLLVPLCVPLISRLARSRRSSRMRHSGPSASRLQLC